MSNCLGALIFFPVDFVTTYDLGQGPHNIFGPAIRFFFLKTPFPFLCFPFSPDIPDLTLPYAELATLTPVFF